MGRLGGSGNVAYRIYGNDHLPPHFHVIGRDVDAMVSIDPIMVIRGDLPTDLRKEVFAWALAHKNQLVIEWNTWNPNIPVVERGLS